MFTIKEIASIYSLSEFYVRKSIREGKLPSTLVSFDNTNRTRHEVEEVDLLEWRSNISSTKRDDGRGKYTIYLNEEELSTLQLLLEDNLEEVSNLLTRTNKKK